MRADVAIFVGIIVLALSLRVTYVLQMRASPFFDRHILDAAYHDAWATAIAEGRTFVEGPYFRAPLYPWFLGGVYALFGRGFLLPRLIQALIGALSCGWLYLLGREAFGRTAGLLAGVAAATYWVFCYYDAELLTESLTVFLDVLLLWCLLRAYRRPGAAGWVGAGVVLGLSAITRPNTLVFIPVVVLWVFWSRRPRPFRSAFVFCCGCLIPILPVTVRNWVVGKDLVLISSQGGVNFYIGNNPQSDGVTAVVPGTPPDWWGGYYASIQKAEQAVGRPLQPSEVSQYYFGEGLRFWAERPGAALNLLLSKLRLFWSSYELGNNQSPWFFAERYAPMVRFLPLSFGVLAPLGLAGIMITWRERVRLLPLWGFVLVYMGSVAAFFVNSRYRLPIVPVLMVYAAALPVSAADWIRWGEWYRVGRAAVVLFCVAAVVLAGTATLPDPTDTHNAHAYATLGLAFQESGRPEEALDAYRHWLAIELQYRDKSLAEARGLAAAGRGMEAAAILRKSVEFLLAYRGTSASFIGLLVDRHEHGEAITVLGELQRRFPEDLETASRLGWLLATCPQDNLRNGDEALRLCLPVVTLKDPPPPWLDALAAAYAEVGRFEEAGQAATRALEGARRSGQEVLARGLEERLALYGDHQPYRE
ncbi:MAG: glycosyltransferase family 39 protein [Planctomycetota bacterium]